MVKNLRLVKDIKLDGGDVITHKVNVDVADSAVEPVIGSPVGGSRSGRAYNVAAIDYSSLYDPTQGEPPKQNEQDQFGVVTPIGIIPVHSPSMTVRYSPPLQGSPESIANMGRNYNSVGGNMFGMMRNSYNSPSIRVTSPTMGLPVMSPQYGKPMINGMTGPVGVSGMGVHVNPLMVSPHAGRRGFPGSDLNKLGYGQYSPGGTHFRDSRGRIRICKNKTCVDITGEIGNILENITSNSDRNRNDDDDAINVTNVVINGSTYSGAGVIVLNVNGGTGNEQVMLFRQSHGNNEYSDLGGSIDSNDIVSDKQDQSLRKTADRECLEESAGLLDMSNVNVNMVDGVNTNNNNSYRYYVVALNFPSGDNIEGKYSHNKDKLKSEASKWRETNDLVQFSLQDILATIPGTTNMRSVDTQVRELDASIREAHTIIAAALALATAVAAVGIANNIASLLPQIAALITSVNQSIANPSDNAKKTAVTTALNALKTTLNTHIATTLAAGQNAAAVAGGARAGAIIAANALMTAAMAAINTALTTVSVPNTTAANGAVTASLTPPAGGGVAGGVAADLATEGVIVYNILEHTALTQLLTYIDPIEKLLQGVTTTGSNVNTNPGKQTVNGKVISGRVMQGIALAHNANLFNNYSSKNVTLRQATVVGKSVNRYS
jgi:hypothetical protein